MRAPRRELDRVRSATAAGAGILTARTTRITPRRARSPPRRESVDMSLRRAALEVCSTSGRSLLPRARSAARRRGPPPHPRRCGRRREGKKIHQAGGGCPAPGARRANSAPYRPRELRRTFPSRVSERDPISNPRAPRTRARPRTALIRKKPKSAHPLLRPSPGHRGDSVTTARSSACAPVARAITSYPLVWRYTLMPINSRTPRAVARCGKERSPRITDAGDARERGTFCDWDRLRSLTPLDADVRRSARFRPHATYRGSISRRLDAVMSNYYFGLEFLKAYPGVYTTVFPWLSERPLGPARLAPRIHPSPRVAHADERFRNIFYSSDLPSLRACG